MAIKKKPLRKIAKISKKSSSSGKKSSRLKDKSSSSDNYEYVNEGDSSDDDKHKKYRVNDDESVDDDGSEVGWDDDDEATFGKFFTKSGTMGDGDEGEEDNEDESDQEEAAEGEVLLSDMLNSNASSKSKSMSAINEEVEEEYEEEEDDDDDDQHDGLLDAVNKFSSTDEKESKRKPKNKALKAFEQSFADSPFSSLTGAGALSMDMLLNPLQSSKGFNAVRSKLTDLSTKTKVPSFVEKTVSERIERGLVYKETSADMDKWKDVVVANRSTKTLDLTDDTYCKPTHKSLIQDFTPITDMERQIEMVLVKSRSSEEEIAAQEEELLKGREMDEDDILRKQTEMGQVRALLFYEQMKRHRINKIKSKAFRRIHKRQRERLAGDKGGVIDDDDDDEGQLDPEEDEFKRVKERMDLKHKNTGKWARMALTYGKGDKTLRYV
jgi:U3 small nucleolar RNA-associated protein 14